MMAAAGCRELLHRNDEAEAEQDNVAARTEEQDVAPEIDLSRHLAGMTFLSREKHEGGFAPPGSDSLFYWRLEFHKDTVSWRHSDIDGDGFTYTVEPDGTIKAFKRRFDDKPFVEGQFFPERGELLWDGLWYQKAD